VRGRPNLFDFVFQAQLPTLDVGNVLVLDRGLQESSVELLLQNTMFFLKRCKMSLNGHVAVPSFCLHPAGKCRMFDVNRVNVPCYFSFVEGEIVAKDNFPLPTILC
jgi:hypothetical protein